MIVSENLSAQFENLTLRSPNIRMAVSPDEQEQMEKEGC